MRTQTPQHLTSTPFASIVYRQQMAPRLAEALEKATTPLKLMRLLYVYLMGYRCQLAPCGAQLAGALAAHRSAPSGKRLEPHSYAQSEIFRAILHSVLPEAWSEYHRVLTNAADFLSVPLESVVADERMMPHVQNVLMPAASLHVVCRNAYEDGPFHGLGVFTTFRMAVRKESSYLKAGLQERLAEEQAFLEWISRDTSSDGAGGLDPTDLALEAVNLSIELVPPHAWEKARTSVIEGAACFGVYYELIMNTLLDVVDLD